MEEKITLEHNRVYFIDYGGTQIVGRFKDQETCQYNFYSLLHYWNGYETFRYNKQYCVTSGITNIRRASKSEIHTLIKNEIENDLH